MTQRTWYVAGPMRGYPDFNFPAFDAAVRIIHAAGDVAISPAEHDRRLYPSMRGTGFTATGNLDDVPEFQLSGAMQWDFHAIIDDADGIALLPGWEASTGARAEEIVARLSGKVVAYVDPIAETFSEAKPRLPIVALCGFAQAGKDTAALGLMEDLGWQRVAFADPLKAVARGLGQSGDKTTPEDRVFLQRLGQVMREEVAADVWLDAGLRAVDGYGPHVPGVVITDCRYPNEADAIRERGGMVVRIDRPGTGPANSHSSEHEMIDYRYDVTIQNDRDRVTLQSRLTGWVAQWLYGYDSRRRW
jgi:hypothetical protein